MKKGILVFSLLLHFIVSAQTQNSITLSEIMFYPLEENGEFIELYNSSSDSSIDISKYHIVYHTSSADTIISFNSGTVLRPNNFAVIFENDYDFENGIYMDLLSDSTLILQIDNGKFGSSGMANTSNRAVTLLNAIGDTIDTYTYTANNKRGYSDEKIDIAGSNHVENWGNTERINGTPGFKNSISPRDYDLSISSFTIIPEEVFVNNEIEFNLDVKNSGVKDATNFGIKIFVDFNRDSIAQSNEIILDKPQAPMVSGDSTIILAHKNFTTNGIFNVFANINYALDEKLENNFYSTQLLIRPAPNMYNDVVINEIMYKPIGDEPEWVEIFNNTNSRINLANWRFADKTSKPKVADSTLFIDSNGYLVLAEDETLLDYYEISSRVVVINLPSLNNVGDKLKIVDSLGQVIDSVEYKSTWGGNNGYSLERISTILSSNDSSNWKSSMSKNLATPGSINSVTPKENDISIVELLSPDNYATIGTDYEIQLKIKNIGLTTINNFEIEIYNDINLDSIAQAIELTQSINGKIIYKGDSLVYTQLLTDFTEGQNNYIVKLVLPTDNNIENNEKSISFVGVLLNEMRGDIVINEIMHSPKSPEPEWFEIFNRSSKNINLKNYKFADNADTVSLLIDELIISPNEYYVFADDSGFVEIYPKVKSVIVSKLPNLNNSGGRILILDSLNRVIDSLYYKSSWGGKSGKSLERIDVDGLSTDSTNWKSTTKIGGGTPAQINSVSVKNHDVALAEVIFTPEIPKIGEDVFVAVTVINIGNESSNFLLQLLEDVNLDSSNIKLLEESSLLSLSPEDSLTHQFNWSIKSIKQKEMFIAKVVSEIDEDSSNNIIKNSVHPGFEQTSIVVNEIMYSPINGEPEWIELLNTTNDSINLSGFTISDIHTTPKTIILETNNFIKPNDYMVISKDSTIWDYHSSIVSPVIITNFANLNNDVDGIVLKDSFGKTIDSVEYKSSWGGKSGFSLERILKLNNSTDSTNWKSSIDIELSTPGRKNSVTPFLNDIAIVEIKTVPEYPTLEDDVFVEAKIKNIGLNVSEMFSLKIKYKLLNSLLLLDEIEYGSLTSMDSVTLKSKKSFKLSDSVKVFIELLYALDENLSNNKIETTIHPGAKRNTIIINEFMANPKTGEAEWIELYNNSQREIDLSSWFLSDLLTTPKLKKVSDVPIIIDGNGFYVISNDTSKLTFESANITEVKFGTLGNFEDGIILYDFNENIIDSLRYNKDWQILKGRSLERISYTDVATEVTNWLPSLSSSGATPGVSNSILETVPSEKNAVIINEIMFDPEVGNSEFVEIFNATENNIDIGGWQLVIDEKDYFEISPTFLTLKAGEYFVVASDSSILHNYSITDKIKILNSGSLSLSNSGESIVVIDHWGNLIDSLLYNPKWHNQNIASTKNKSLERIAFTVDANEPTNWSTSVSKEDATPGKVNSIFAKNDKAKEGISFNPNPFSPDSDGFEDFTIINYSLPYNTAQIRIKIFDDHGRLVRTLVNNRAVASNGSIIFDGLDDDGNTLRIGMYILFLEASDINSGANKSYKDIIVVARKL